MFSNLSAKLFMGFYFQSCREKVYYATINLLVNPDTQSGQSDLRSSCFAVLIDYVLHIWRGSVFRNEWGIEVLHYRGFSASCDFQKGFVRLCSKMFSKLSIKIFMGLQRTPLSLHPVIFEKGSLRLLTKRFSNLSTKLFMGFIYGFAENPSFSASCDFQKGSVRLCSKMFSKLSSRIFMGFYFQSCRERVYYATINSLVNPDTQSGPSVLVLQSSCFGPRGFCPTYMEGLGNEK